MTCCAAVVGARCSRGGGRVLNQLVDTEYVDPSARRKSSRAVVPGAGNSEAGNKNERKVTCRAVSCSEVRGLGTLTTRSICRASSCGVRPSIRTSSSPRPTWPASAAPKPYTR